MQTRRTAFLRKPIQTSVLTILAIAVFALCKTSQGALVAYWDFDEGTGTVVTDRSGSPNNKNGTFGTGAETPSWVPGRLGTAVNFDWTTANNAGAGDRVIVPFHPDLQLNGPFTVSFWYRPDQPFPAGQFPGIMRIGSQGNSPPNWGWGFFRTSNMVFKRGNVQPGRYPNMNIGEWYHIALRYDGVLNSPNTLYYINGQQLNPFVATNGWTNVLATTIFEMGRMDHFDDATLDDLALWGSEAIAPARIRSLYTVPTSLGIDYNLADMRTLWGVFDGAGTSNATVKGSMWSYASSLPGSTTPGDAYISGGSMYVVLGAGTGVSAPITIITGTFSPSGIGRVSTLSLVGMPAITVNNANVHFDINQDTTPGGGVNDLIDVAGDLTFVNSTVSIGPFGSLPGGTYRLFTYTGTKTGSPTILNTTRYTLTLDESTPGEINLVVSGSPGLVRWNSTSSGAWDLTTSNWFNQVSMTTDRFFQGDAVVFDDAGPYQTNITIAGAVFVDEMLVNSSRNYGFTGAGQIAGNDEGLLKLGSGMLTLGTANTFVGDVNINEGTLRLGNSSALGTTNGGTTVAAGATLDLGGSSPGTEAVTVQGAGVNNAGAVVNTGGALGNNGLRGRVTLTGDTTFGGVNRWDVIGGTLVGNGFRLTKVGTPEIALTDLGETGLGPIDINQGILTMLGTTRAGDPTQPITVNTNAILALWDTRVVLDKPVVMNQAIMRNSTSGGVNISTNVGAVTLNGDATFQATANIALLGVVSGTGNLIKVNNGTLYLGGVNTYSGRTTISAGRLALLDGGSITTTPRITLASAGILDVSRLTTPFAVSSGQILSGNGAIVGALAVPAGGTVLPGSENIAATLTASNGLSLEGGTLSYDIAAATTEGGGVNDLINVTGDLNLTGTTTINLNPLGVLTVGNTYTLINYTGALTGSEANLAISTSSRYMFSVSVATPGKVTVTVMGGAASDLFWLGGAIGAENLWDLQTSMNWSDSLGNPETFFGGDKVTFDDFATTNIVDLVGALTPASILVENGSVDYVFQGSGKLSGNSSLTKRFGSKLSIVNSGVNDFVGAVTVEDGTLEVGNGATSGNLGIGAVAIVSNTAAVVFNRSDTLTVANTLSGEGRIVKQNSNLMQVTGNNSNYTGNITVNGGTLRPGHTNALGPAGGATTIAAGATLDINALNLGAESVTVAGAGVGGAGAIINSAGGQNNALRFVTFADNTTVGGTGRWDIRANPSGALLTGGNPFTLTKVGNNQVSLVDLMVDPALGDINVNSGTLSVEIGTMAGDPTRTMTVANNATVLFWARTQPWNKVAVLNGGRNILNGNGATVMAGPVTLNSTVTFEVAGTSLTVMDPIGGTGALTKTGGSPLILAADNTYPGTTTISSGALQLGTGTNAGWVAGNLIMGGNALTVYRSDMVTVSNTLTATGPLNLRTPEGFVIGNNTVNFSVINIGQNNVAGKLILQSGFTGNIGALSAGDASGNAPGNVDQFGGTLNVSGLCRIGHWPNETSTYLMGGGALNVTATPTGVVNLGGQPEQIGVIYLGVDGTGILIQTGGVVRAHGIVFDGRGNTAAGIDTFTLTGGETIIGPSGFKSGALDANASFAINLGGGKITSSANWSSALRMSLTGMDGNVIFDTAGFSNALSGPLTGPGGLIKAGSGTLAIMGTANYEGQTEVRIGGVLLVRGSLGSGIGLVTVRGGAPAGAALAGDGTINDPVEIHQYGTIRPGTQVPSFTPSTSFARLTINNTLSFPEPGGSADMEISKSGSALTNDLIAVSGAINYGGRLIVRASGDTLANGDVFNLFDATSFTGSFEDLFLPSLPAGLYWDTSKLAVDGTIRVTGPRLTFSRSGNSFSLSWPEDTTLQAQTNAPGGSLNSTNWVTVDPGTNSVTVTVDPSVGSVFFRLLRP